MSLPEGCRRGSTVLNVFFVALVAALFLGLFLVAVQKPRPVMKARVAADISNLMTALVQYYSDFGAYPPGGTDLNDNGNLDDPGDDYGSGHLPADPAHPKITELQLRALCVKLPAENNTRTVGPYYFANRNQIDRQGRFIDAWGNPLRYLSNGTRRTLDPKTGKPLPGRVDRGPVIWSVGPDGKQDPKNNNLDDDGNGKVDDPDELRDDICTWN